MNYDGENRIWDGSKYPLEIGTEAGWGYMDHLINKWKPLLNDPDADAPNYEKDNE